MRSLPSGAHKASGENRFISAAVCTYNRCVSLKDTLDSLTMQVLNSDATLEIVVVDNNSTDRTRQVVEEAAKHSPWPVRYVKELNQGIAHARNRGLLSAQGDLVAFIDDDAVARQDWAAKILRCFEETGADLVGGKIEPLWQTPRPHWLSDDLMGPIIFLDFGPNRKRCTNGETFLTTNCSIRRSSVSRYGMFDVTLGRRGIRWVGGEDLDLCRRWHRQGAHVVYEPVAVVDHKVSPERVTEKFYRLWFEDIGYTQGHQLDWKWHHSLSIVPAWRWQKLCRAGVRYLTARAVPSPEPVRLNAEFWWTFEKSFLKERFGHWIARWRGTDQPRCHFSIVSHNGRNLS